MKERERRGMRSERPVVAAPSRAIAVETFNFLAHSTIQYFFNGFLNQPFNPPSRACPTNLPESTTRTDEQAVPEPGSRSPTPVLSSAPFLDKVEFLVVVHATHMGFFVPHRSCTWTSRLNANSTGHLSGELV